MFYNFITNPYAIYGALYKEIYLDLQNNGPVFTPKRKKIKGYQKSKHK